MRLRCCTGRAVECWLKFDESVIPVRQWGRKTRQLKNEKNRLRHSPFYYYFYFYLIGSSKTVRPQKYFFPLSPKRLGALEAVLVMSNAAVTQNSRNGLPSSSSRVQNLFTSFPWISLDIMLVFLLFCLLFLFFFFLIALSNYRIFVFIHLISQRIKHTHSVGSEEMWSCLFV